MTSSATAIVTWIEHTYNNRRRQRGPGKLTPVEFELAFTNRDEQLPEGQNPWQLNLQQTQRPMPRCPRSSGTSLDWSPHYWPRVRHGIGRRGYQYGPLEVASVAVMAALAGGS